MVQKNSKTKTTAAKKSTKAANAQKARALTIDHKTGFDLMSSVLIISLLINLFVLSIWITLQLTSNYDTALYDFFIHRG